MRKPGDSAQHLSRQSLWLLELYDVLRKQIKLSPFNMKESVKIKKNKL